MVSSKIRRLKVQFWRQRSVRLDPSAQSRRPRPGWCWRIRAENGRIIAASSESYLRRVDATRNFNLVTGFGVTPGHDAEFILLREVFT